MATGIERSSSLAGMRILIVEDELLVALELETMLDSLGCQVVGPAARLEKAHELLQSAEIDGAILDVNVRGQSVYPVAAALKSRGIPFIFSTGYSGASAMPEPFGNDPRIEKPFVQEELARLMVRTFSPQPAEER